MQLSLDPLSKLSFMAYILKRVSFFDNIPTFLTASKKFWKWNCDWHWKWHCELDMRQYWNSMLFPERMSYSFLFSIIELREKILSVTLNVFLYAGYNGKYTMGSRPNWYQIGSKTCYITKVSNVHVEKWYQC